MPGLGHRSFMQIGKETTFGTAVAPTGNRLEVINFNIAPSVGVIPDPSLYAAQSRRGLYQGGLLYRGTITLRVNYDGMLEIFRGASGTYSTTTVESGVVDHFFKEGPTLNSYTIEASIGDVPAGKVFRLTGAKFTGLAIRGTAGQGTDAMVQVEVTVIAKDMQSNQSLAASTNITVANCTTNGTTTLTTTGNFTSAGVLVGMQITGTDIPPGTLVASAVGTTTLVMSNTAITNATQRNMVFTLSFPFVHPVLFHQSGSGVGGAVDDGTADAAASVRVRSFELTLENPHAEDRFYLGSVNIDEPIRSDFLTARWRFTQEFTTQTQWDAARAFTAPGAGLGSPRLQFREPGTIGSSSFREFEIRSEQAQLTELTAPVDGYGVLISTATWEAFNNPGDASALVIRVRNTTPPLP